MATIIRKGRAYRTNHNLLMSEQCAALDINGKRCRKRGVRVVNYHGRDELYNHDSPEPNWVRVAFCADHSREPKKAKA